MAYLLGQNTGFFHRHMDVLHMDKQYFLNNYIGKFNKQDPTGFEEFFAPDIKMYNGSLLFEGVEAVKEHYHQIWSVMDETLNVIEYYDISDSRLIIELHTHFYVPETKIDTPFGEITKGQKFDFHGLIQYKINEDNKFYEVKVAYFDFIKTEPDGSTVNIGAPH